MKKILFVLICVAGALFCSAQKKTTIVIKQKFTNTVTPITQKGAYAALEVIKQKRGLDFNAFEAVIAMGLYDPATRKSTTLYATDYIKYVQKTGTLLCVRNNEILGSYDIPNHRTPHSIKDTQLFLDRPHKPLRAERDSLIESIHATHALVQTTYVQGNFNRYARTSGVSVTVPDLQTKEDAHADYAKALDRVDSLERWHMSESLFRIAEEMMQHPVYIHMDINKKYMYKIYTHCLYYTIMKKEN
ncbi:MAG: hypothetical protein LRY46_02265 [Candidatus Pacebacteria bacterium]|nr:hypothetical protein [Candidatus Paceibacterota bacterium]